MSLDGKEHIIATRRRREREREQDSRMNFLCCTKRTIQYDNWDFDQLLAEEAKEDEDKEDRME